MNLPISSKVSVWVAGCGDIGQRVALLWQAQSAQVLGLVHSDASVERLQQAGINAVSCDLDMHDLALPPLAENTVIYYFIPPPSSGVSDSRCSHFLNALSQQEQKPQRIIAISTTGVYGDCEGNLIDEEQTPRPKADRALRRFDMEQQLKAWCERNHVALIILRVGGIYGPARLPLERIKQGVPVLKEELAPKTNRIHEDDLARICVAAVGSEHAYRIYNISDGSNSNMTEYFFTLADHYGLPRPPAVDWQQAEQKISAGMLSYLRESRRIDNTRMLKELNIKLLYPDLQTALQAMDKTGV